MGLVCEICLDSSGGAWGWLGLVPASDIVAVVTGDNKSATCRWWCCWGRQEASAEQGEDGDWCRPQAGQRFMGRPMAGGAVMRAKSLRKSSGIPSGANWHQIQVSVRLLVDPGGDRAGRGGVGEVGGNGDLDSPTTLIKSSTPY